MIGSFWEFIGTDFGHAFIVAAIVSIICLFIAGFSACQGLEDNNMLLIFLAIISGIIFTVLFLYCKHQYYLYQKDILKELVEVISNEKIY